MHDRLLYYKSNTTLKQVVLRQMSKLTLQVPASEFEDYNPYLVEANFNPFPGFI